MDDYRLLIEPLGARQARAGFSCGEPALDSYLARQASQEIRRRVAQVFVGIDPGADASTIQGYYTLSAASFAKEGLPPPLAGRLPHYPVPAALLGRLAVDRACQGRGIGEALLMDALRRVVRVSLGMAVYAIVVDAKNDAARAFYERYGFRALIDGPRRLFLPVGTAEKLGL